MLANNRIIVVLVAVFFNRIDAVALVPTHHICEGLQ